MGRTGMLCTHVLVERRAKGSPGGCAAAPPWRRSAVVRMRCSLCVSPGGVLPKVCRGFARLLCRLLHWGPVKAAARRRRQRACLRGTRAVHCRCRPAHRPALLKPTAAAPRPSASDRPELLSRIHASRLSAPLFTPIPGTSICLKSPALRLCRRGIVTLPMPFAARAKPS